MHHKQNKGFLDPATMQQQDPPLSDAGEGGTGGGQGGGSTPALANHAPPRKRARVAAEVAEEKADNGLKRKCNFEEGKSPVCSQMLADQGVEAMLKRADITDLFTYQPPGTCRDAVTVRVSDDAL
eukprot:266486-Rhodomonas_salina.2